MERVRIRRRPADGAAVHRVAPGHAARAPRFLPVNCARVRKPDAPPGRTDQPPLAARVRCSGSAPEIRAAFGSRHRRFLFPSASSAPRDPRRVADHERRAAFGKKSACTTSMRSRSPNAATFSARKAARAGEIRRDHAYRCRAARAPRRARQCPCRIEINACRSAHRRQWRRSDKVDVLTADGREDTEVRMDSAPASESRCLSCALVRTDHTDTARTTSLMQSPRDRRPPRRPGAYRAPAQRDRVVACGGIKSEFNVASVATLPCR